MSDIHEISRKLTALANSGSIRQKEVMITTLINDVQKFVKEIKDEVELAKEAQRVADQLKAITHENKNKSKDELTNEDREAERNIQDLFDKVTRANQHIGEKKQMLRSFAQRVDELRSELREFN